MRLFAFFMEILPLAGFFIGFELGGIFVAAIVQNLLGAALMALAWFQQKRVALFLLFRYPCCNFHYIRYSHGC